MSVVDIFVVSGNIPGMRDKFDLFFQYPYRSLALLMALAATLGSLFFSEYLQLVPCKLCWWQRIFMYPLVFVLAVGIWRKEKRLYEYVLPVAVIGFLITLYHNLIYYYQNIFLNGANETLSIACSGGVSCTNAQLEWGLVSIPLLSLISFGWIVGMMLVERKREK